MKVHVQKAKSARRLFRKNGSELPSMHRMAYRSRCWIKERLMQRDSGRRQLPRGTGGGLSLRRSMA